MGELGINSSAHTEYITFKPTEQTCSRACLFIFFLVVVGFGDFFFLKLKAPVVMLCCTLNSGVAGQCESKRSLSR